MLLCEITPRCHCERSEAITVILSVMSNHRHCESQRPEADSLLRYARKDIRVARKDMRVAHKDMGVARKDMGVA